MKKSIVLGIAVSFLTMQLAMAVASGETATQPPPVGQTLVREGDLAIQLVDRLKIGSAANEAEAESLLASKGIAPRNGWIGDYPVTPDIIGELQGAVAEAADSQKLAISKDEASQQFQELTAEMGVSLVADNRGEVPPEEAAEDYGEYSNPDVINNYYYDEGPPVVTYYTPPWDYYYMYAWVPYPFWSSGFFFRGFFMLHDFHRRIFFHGRPCFVSNHFRDPRTHRFHTIDPVRRHGGDGFRADGDSPRHRGFSSAEAKKGAASIIGRTRERTNSFTGPRGGRSLPANRGDRTQFQRPERGNRSITPNIRGNDPRRPSTPNRGTDRSMGGARSPAPGPSERSFGRQRGSDGRGIAGSGGPAGRMSRSFVPPSRAPSRGSTSSFNAPSRGGGRSFSAPSAHGRGSVGTPQGNVRSGGPSARSFGLGR